MKPLLVAAALIALLPCREALVWGQEGHSIVAEIAQRRLSDQAKAEVARLLAGASLASVSSWADDQRSLHPETGNWHFVDIPLAEVAYVPARDCAASPHGDCVVAELGRLRDALHCGHDNAERAVALKYLVHFVGDVHQPLHAVGDERGGNDHPVTLAFKGRPCIEGCQTNLHAAWDSLLIERTVYAWGSYVDRLEAGWLRSDAARTLDVSIDFGHWAEETHLAAKTVWGRTPADGRLDEAYLASVQPVLDEQLGRSGLRLAALLEDVTRPDACPRH